MGTDKDANALGEPMQIHLTVKNTFIDGHDDDNELDDGDRFDEALRRMVSEPIPTRQFSGNQHLGKGAVSLLSPLRNITVVKEAHGEEEDAEQETAHLSSAGPFGSSSAAEAVSSRPMTVMQERGIEVKNTFINVGEDDGCDAGLREIVQARQQSEPASAWNRQMSNLSVMSGSSRTMGMHPGMSMAGMSMPSAMGDEAYSQEPLKKELPEEPETEIEPQMQGDETPWGGNYFGQSAFPSGPFGGAFSSDMMFPQQGPESMEIYGGMETGVKPLDAPPVPAEWAATYTVMMRNLPNRYTQRMLLEEICNSGFGGTFDFLYLPIDPDTNANKGYGFINFLEPIHAWQFKCAYEGKQMSRFNSSKFVSVSPAALQGLEANYAHYSTSRCSRGDPAARPLFLREPQQTMNTRPSARPSRRGGRRRLQDVSLVDVAVRNQRQPGAKSEAKPLPPGQMFGLGRAAAPGQTEPAKGGADAAPSQAKFCPFCGGACKPEFRFCQFCGSSLDVLQGL